MASISLWAVPAPGVRGQVALTITMADALTFSPNTFSAAPGESVSLTLINAGNLPHTFTLFDDVDADVPLDPSGLDNYYNTHDKLVDLNFTSGQELSHTFTAPATEGTYTLVCMEPGHVPSMVGTMTVTSEPPPEPSDIDPLLIGVVIAVVVIVIAIAAVFILRRRS